MKHMKRNFYCLTLKDNPTEKHAKSNTIYRPQKTKQNEQ